MDSPREIAQWIALNLASWLVVLTPANSGMSQQMQYFYHVDLTDGAEFVVKMAVGVSVIVLNVIKIRDWSTRKHKDE